MDPFANFGFTPEELSHLPREAQEQIMVAHYMQRTGFPIETAQDALRMAYETHANHVRHHANHVRQEAERAEREHQQEMNERQRVQGSAPEQPQRIVTRRATQPLSKVILGELKQGNRRIQQAAKAADEFREFRSLHRAANHLKTKGYKIPPLELPEYFDSMEEKHTSPGRIMDDVVEKLSQHPNIRLSVPERNRLSIEIDRDITRRNQLNIDQVENFARRYLDALVDRDPSLRYTLDNDGDYITLRMQAAATNLNEHDYDVCDDCYNNQDEDACDNCDRETEVTGQRVNPNCYPWLAEIMKDNILVPISTAEWIINRNRGVQSNSRNESSFPEDIIVNRHLNSHNCYGSVRNAIRDTSRLKQGIAQAYTALVSMNLHESASFPGFSNRYYKFFNTQTNEEELIDIYQYKCQVCTDKEGCDVSQDQTRRCNIYQEFRRDYIESISTDEAGNS